MTERLYFHVLLFQRPLQLVCLQLFSSAGQIYADRRSNLLGENAEKLLVLAYNICLFQFNYWQKIDVSVSLDD